MRRAYLVSKRVEQDTLLPWQHVAVAFQREDEQYEVVEYTDEGELHAPVVSTLDDWHTWIRTSKVKPILHRREQLRDPGEYHRVLNNCEHIALYLFCGIRISTQVVLSTALTTVLCLLTGRRLARHFRIHR